MRVLALAWVSLVAACASSGAPPAERGVTTLVLQHQPASDVAPILEEVLQSRDTCARAPVQEQSVTPVRIEASTYLQVRADPARNALLIRGTSVQVLEALELARLLDVPGVTIDRAR